MVEKERIETNSKKVVLYRDITASSRSLTRLSGLTEAASYLLSAASVDSLHQTITRERERERERKREKRKAGRQAGSEGRRG